MYMGFSVYRLEQVGNFVESGEEIKKGAAGHVIGDLATQTRMCGCYLSRSFKVPPNAVSSKPICPVMFFMGLLLLLRNFLVVIYSLQYYLQCVPQNCIHFLVNFSPELRARQPPKSINCLVYVFLSSTIKNPSLNPPRKLKFGSSFNSTSLTS